VNENAGDVNGKKGRGMEWMHASRADAASSRLRYSESTGKVWFKAKSGTGNENDGLKSLPLLYDGQGNGWMRRAQKPVTKRCSSTSIVEEACVIKSVLKL
jgi:hypothetical protein